jgi:uncharacterized protein
MKGVLVRFYMREDQRHGSRQLWEWLLEQANMLGIRGGSVFKAMGGFGRHHRLSEAKFFELAGSLGIEVQFVVTEAEAASLHALLERERVHVFYAQTAAEFGITGSPDPASP